MLASSLAWGKPDSRNARAARGGCGAAPVARGRSPTPPGLRARASAASQLLELSALPFGGISQVPRKRLQTILMTPTPRDPLYILPFQAPLSLQGAGGRGPGRPPQKAASRRPSLPAPSPACPLAHSAAAPAARCRGRPRREAEGAGRDRTLRGLCPRSLNASRTESSSVSPNPSMGCYASAPTLEEASQAPAAYDSP